MNILLSSVGRRPYLVQWFADALRENLVAGKVIAADIDEYSPAKMFADLFVLAPRVDSEEYLPWLRQVVSGHEIDMAISINDFELSVWANLPPLEEWKSLIRLTPEIQNTVEDKYLMGHVLEEHGIKTPQTWLGGDAAGIFSGSEKRYVTKGRFGSASRGLQFVNPGEIQAAITGATSEVTNRAGIAASVQKEHKPADLVVVQEMISGVEFGLDIVSDMNKNFSGVLARKKLTMRSGETDRAVSVSSRNFQKLAESISKAIPHQGTIDVDVIVDRSGQQYVIDINPRFGGGYPFSHLAGARVPNAYIAWQVGQQINPNWLHVKEGIVGGKYVETVEIV